MITQERLIEEIRQQPEEVLREVWHYLKFLERQAIGAVPRVRFERRLGTVAPSDLTAIKQALIKACALSS